MSQQGGCREPQGIEGVGDKREEVIHERQHAALEDSLLYSSTKLGLQRATSARPGQVSKTAEAEARVLTG